MRTRPCPHPLAPCRERGAVLVVAMLMLVAITVLSTTAVSMSLMELRMSGNTEANADSFQTGVAAVDYVLSDPANLPATGPLNVPEPVALAGTPFAAHAGDSITASAARLEDCGVPPRMTNGTSMTAYSSFRYEVAAEVARDASGLGRASMVQGYLLLGPKC